MSIIVDLPLAYTARVIAIARDNIGVRETPGKPNRGPAVDMFIREAGLDPERGSYPWCVAFLQYCFRQAARDLGVVPYPIPRTASVSKLWSMTAQLHVGRPIVGSIFCMDHGAGKGHAGLVVDVVEGRSVTIEGNSNAAGSRDADRVVERSRRTGEVLGFINVAPALVPLAA